MDGNNHIARTLPHSATGDPMTTYEEQCWRENIERRLADLEQRLDNPWKILTGEPVAIPSTEGADKAPYIPKVGH